MLFLVKLYFPFFVQYLDDILCAFPEDLIDETCHNFKKYNTQIQFPIERENKSNVPFLNTLDKIVKFDNKIYTKKY